MSGVNRTNKGINAILKNLKCHKLGGDYMPNGYFCLYSAQKEPFKAHIIILTWISMTCSSFLSISKLVEESLFTLQRTFEKASSLTLC